MLPDAWKGKFVSKADFMLPEKASLVLQREFMLPEKASLVPFRREFTLPVKATLLVPRREFIISQRKKLVPKMELRDSDNRSLVATSGTCSILVRLAEEITWPSCSTKSWRLTLSDVFEVQTLFEPSTPLKNTLRENTGHNTWMLCLIIRRK